MKGVSRFVQLIEGTRQSLRPLHCHSIFGHHSSDFVTSIRQSHSSGALTTSKTISIDEIRFESDELTVAAVRPYFLSKHPVVVRQAMMAAPAVQNWKDWSYIERKVDLEAICHVEIGGGNYSRSSNQRAEIRLGDYLAYLRLFEERYGRSGGTQPANEDLVYLAQNDLVEGLDLDFDLPAVVSKLGEGRLYSVMMWIGPYGCSSPLHFDPLDNALMQFVGVKKVLLYPPDASVYAGEEGNQSNTSPINFEEPLDLIKFPLLATLPPPIMCTLMPGDLLYIPQTWWHQVRTIETSLSVNAWWR